jgi:Inner membrane component of T3SS, cytoplasmic domain
MSFRLFIYYCAICGGGAAYFGWVLGLLVSLKNSVAVAGIQGLFLGMMVAFGLGLVDSLWNTSDRNPGVVLGRVFVAVTVGCLGGLLGGILGQAFFGWTQLSISLIFGWTITGLLIGVSLGMFDLLVCMMRQENPRGAYRKLFHGVLGGSVGGALGGVLYLLMQNAWVQLFRTDDLWSPSATGFVALGACIGLLIGLTQVIFKEAWLKVESGFRAGRELLLSRPEMTIGRAEGCDLGLFGDAGVDKIHARIKHEGPSFILSDEGSATGTWVNEERVQGSRRLESGDLIRVGRSLVRFGERQK